MDGLGNGETVGARTQGGEPDGAQVTAPPRLARFVRRVSRLQPGKYVLTLTVKEDTAFWTIQEMGRVEG